MFGLVDPMQTIWTKQSPAWSAELEREQFDLERARAPFSDAGWPNGFETTIQASSAYPELIQFDQVIQADLAKIGITAHIEVLEGNEALRLVHSSPLLEPDQPHVFVW
jgi:ABC-type transport system substrate-binding protein